MTFEKAFDSIKKKFDKAKVKEINDFALQVTMSDEDCGGTFYIAVQNGVLDVAPYDYKDNNAVLDIKKSDFVSLISGKKSLEKAVDGGASLKGDASVIDSVKALIAPAKTTAKKPAAKTAAKKTTAKKPAAKTTAKKTTAKKPAAKKAEPAKAAAKPAAKKAEPAKTEVKPVAPAKTEVKAAPAVKDAKKK